MLPDSEFLSCSKSSLSFLYKWISTCPDDMRTLVKIIEKYNSIFIKSAFSFLFYLNKEGIPKTTILSGMTIVQWL